MTYEQFLEQPVSNGHYRGMIRSSFVRITWDASGYKAAKQLLNGYFGGWVSECRPTSLEQGKARNFINNFSRSEA
jgi:hypothetical protein